MELYYFSAFAKKASRSGGVDWFTLVHMCGVQAWLADRGARYLKKEPAAARLARSPYFVPGLPHVMLIESRQALISCQDYHMLCLSSLGQALISYQNHHILCLLS